MFCPECRSEYRPGFTHCNDCDVDLVWELPRDEHQDPNLVKVYETGNPALASVVESLLNGSDIPSVVRNRHAHGALGGDAFTRNPVEFWVRENDADDARNLLADLSRYDGATGHEPE
jgi:hypothetical protein